MMSDNTLTVGQMLLTCADTHWHSCPACTSYRGTTDAWGIFWGHWNACGFKAALHNCEGKGCHRAGAALGRAAWGCSCCLQWASHGEMGFWTRAPFIVTSSCLWSVPSQQYKGGLCMEEGATSPTGCGSPLPGRAYGTHNLWGYSFYFNVGIWVYFLLLQLPVTIFQKCTYTPEL